MVIETNSSAAIEALFQESQDTLIWSCLQGVMGHLYLVSEKQPVSVMAQLGDFTFFAGTPEKELVQFKPEDCRRDFMIMVPLSDEWASLIEEVYGKRAEKIQRYAIKKEPLSVFDSGKLKRNVDGLPDGYTVKMIDEELFYRCRRNLWSRDLVSNYGSYDSYRTWGLGAVILKGEELVSGASSYSAYRGGIEIEVDTKNEYRRKGLAGVCSATLILECIKRGWYPSWDAQNLWSVSLAEKLGYHFECAYTAYEISEY